MKTVKQRQKHVTLLKHELQKIYARTTSIIIRRSIQRARNNLKSILDFFDNYDTDISKLKNDVAVLRGNNLGLARGIQNERENSKSLIQDKIIAESSYQDLFREHVILKKELWNVEQILLNYDDELKNSMIPNLVKLSDDITKFKLKSNVIRKNIETKRSNDSLPRNTWSSSINSGSNSNQPISAVNPMIKGCVIQQPTINVRRMSLPRDENRNSLFANVDIASPIMEEPEEMQELDETLSPVNNSSNRRCKNGLRQMLHLSNGQTGRRPTQPIPDSEISYCDSSEGNDNGVNVRVEPVVRLCDVSRLLRHSTLRISEPENQSSPAKENFTAPMRGLYSPEVLLKRISTPKPLSFESTMNNPLEGCSWMYRTSPNAYGDGAEHTSPWAQPRRSTPADHNVPVNRRLSIFNVNSSGEQRDSGYEHESLPQQSFKEDELRVSNSKKSNFVRTPNSFENENCSPPKTGKSKKMETTFLTSTLNSSALLKSTKKRFFRHSGPEADNSTDMLNDSSGDRNSVAARRVNDEVECTSTSLLTADPNVVNSPRLSLLLQNCTTRRRGKQSRKSTFQHAKNDKDHGESSSSEVEDVHEPTLKVPISSNEVSSGKSVRPVRASRLSKRINYAETDGRNEDDEAAGEPAPKKRNRSQSRRRVREVTNNHDVTSSGTVSSTDRRRTKKSQTLVDDSGSECTSRSGSSLSLNDYTQELENSRPVRVSGRNRANISYKEKTLNKKLRREH